MSFSGNLSCDSVRFIGKGSGCFFPKRNSIHFSDERLMQGHKRNARQRFVFRLADSVE